MDISETVLAAVTDVHGRTSTARLPLPTPQDDSGLLRVLASGVCGTDRALVAQRDLTEATILGHHVVGRIAGLGAAAAQRWGVQEGDLVAVQEYLPCHDCRWCERNQHRMCERSDIRTGGRRVGLIGVSEAPGLWGGNAEYMFLPPEALVHRLPDGMDPGRAVWLLPLANAFDWTTETGSITPGDTVVIIGPGQHGLTCVVAARESGADHVIVVGRESDAQRLELSTKLGADATVGLGDGESLERVAQLTGHDGADLVVNTSGAGPDLTARLVGLAGKRATVVEAGLATGNAQVDMAAVTERALRLVGARGRSATAIDRAIASLSVDSGGHALDVIPSHDIGLTDVDGVLNDDTTEDPALPVHVVVRP